MFKSSGCKLLTLTTSENVNNNCSSREDSNIMVSSKVIPKLIF